MNGIDPQTLAFYAAHAGDSLAAARRMESADRSLLDEFLSSFHTPHSTLPGVSSVEPHTCPRVLDVGCGAGGDLAHLLSRGLAAFGVDASPEQIGAAHAHLRARGLDPEGRLSVAALPALDGCDDQGFDAVLCSAVLMHLPEEDLFDAAYGLRRVLKPGGRLLVSIPEQRADLPDGQRRDARGRLFTGLTQERLALLLERVGFQAEGTRVSPDRLERPGITWANLRLRLPLTPAERPLHQVEGILNRDKKDATYKLALFRALAELAQTQSHVADFLPDGRVGVPTRAIALKWLYYYWPLIDGPNYIAQKNGEAAGCRKPTVVRSAIEPLALAYRARGGLTAFHADLQGGRLSPADQSLADKALSLLQKTIWNMPARYAGGPEEFTVFQYDRPHARLLMQASLWRELCLTGSWIADATLLRWAELCAAFSRGAVRTSQVVDRLLVIPDSERRVQDAREVFLHLPDKLCVWTGTDLKRDFAVDHAIPFSLWRNNDLWNLFPTDKNVNGGKSDKVPTWDLVKRQRELIVLYWRHLHGKMDQRFEREAQTLLGRDAFHKDTWEGLLFSRFAEAMESTAVQRGCERWQPEGFVRERPAAPTPIRVSPVPYAVQSEGLVMVREDPERTSPRLLDFAEVGADAYRRALPLVGRLAAGGAFHGFDIEGLHAEAESCPWVAVPEKLAGKNRFIVHVAGDSMSPTLPQGALAVFEYHRTPREDVQIVIANLTEAASGTTGTETIKRLRATPDTWRFESDNPAYQAFEISRAEHPYPILGVFVGRVEEGIPATIADP